MIETFFHSFSPISLWCSYIQLTYCSRDYLACLLLCLCKSQPVCESLFQTCLCLLPGSLFFLTWHVFLHSALFLFLFHYSSINVFILLSSIVKQPIYNA